ncbi:LysR family transcriptional regulator [Marinisporobacter balticus]|uniref:DNA-binding transcriptional LysR family regulator n=1 Tax=Marinisporobacter balticus TaxID=2018667 RepID=A0A4R2KNZ4_9FIRM|nr:LysR family transcriptional regulator [Marinisporobacter balticus]TCO75234.1 DNA-binding transcriptional LysR family regulator [Marinisporobacter balticus]
MEINFELYKVFYFVGKYLSFSQAANNLYISQSAVSQSIKLLEEKLNSKLFFRHTKEVKFTVEGELLFKHIEQAFNFIKSGERSVGEIHSLKKGEVRIGASDTICKYYLLPFLKKFHEIYPDIKIHIINRPSPVCAELLKKGSVDMSVINLPHKIVYKNMHFKEIKKIQDVFIAGSSFKNLKGKVLSLKELENYPLLLLEKNSTTRNFFDAFIKKHNVAITPEFELGSIDLLVELTKIGLGISYVMLDAIKDTLEKEKFFILNIKEKPPQRSIGVLHNTNIPIPIATQKFIDLLYD